MTEFIAITGEADRDSRAVVKELADDYAIRLEPFLEASRHYAGGLKSRRFRHALHNRRDGSLRTNPLRHVVVADTKVDSSLECTSITK